MALRNLNYDSTLRGILQSRSDSLDSLIAATTAKLEECGLKPNGDKAVRDFPREPLTREQKKAGQTLGTVRGGENFNARGIQDWVESIYKEVPTLPAGAPDLDKPAHEEQVKNLADAHAKLIAIHATLLAQVR